MSGYKQNCRYCDKLVEGDSNVCPYCRKVNPVGEIRCQKCRTPVKSDWKACNGCGLVLEIDCPKCGKKTFFGDYCAACNARLTVLCPNPKCKTEQAPVGTNCIKCGKPLYPKK